MIRNIIAVIAGYLSIAVLTLFTFFCIDWLFPNAFPEPEGFPTLSWAVFILCFSLLYALVGGYVTAWLSGGRKGAIAALALVLLILAAISLWTNPEQQPLWYELTMLGFGMGGALLGGSLRLYVVRHPFHHHHHPLRPLKPHR
jgi:O-antigen/teichoic acid export membrane protein